MKFSGGFINNLFGTFDPQGIFNVSLNWSASLIVFVMFPPLYWVSTNKISQLILSVVMTINNEFRMIFSALFYPGMTFLTTSLFMWISITNFFGLFPYIFTPTSHLVFTLALALPIWLGHMSMSITKNFNSTLGHFVPLSTPMILAPFMVLIELISSIIRPLTLAVRLAANMIAGHLLLTLLSSSLINQSLAVMVSVFFPLIILIVLEMSVSLIQAYVFSLLSTLYLNEVSDVKMM